MKVNKESLRAAFKYWIQDETDAEYAAECEELPDDLLAERQADYLLSVLEHLSEGTDAS